MSRDRPRIALITPSLTDPAHRRVSIELGEALSRRCELARIPARPGETSRESARRLRRALRRGLDAVYVQFFSRGLSWLGSVGIPTTTRLVLTHQGASVRFMDHPAVFRALARRADVVTSVSRAGLKELVAAFPRVRGKGRVVPNGVRFRGAAAAPPRASRPYILTVGRLAAYKGLDILALAFCRLAAEHPELRWIACGPDQTRGELGRFVRRLGLSSRVRLEGRAGTGRVARLLDGCSVFVHPSRRENAPMALLEAMAAGKPIVASRTGGIAEAARSGKEALLVPPGDPGALTRGIRRVLSDARLRRRLGSAAKRRVRGFGWDHAAELYLREYRRGGPSRRHSGGSRNPAWTPDQVRGDDRHGSYRGDDRRGT